MSPTDDVAVDVAAEMVTEEVVMAEPVYDAPIVDGNVEADVDVDVEGNVASIEPATADGATEATPAKKGARKRKTTAPRTRTARASKTKTAKKKN
jgi:hypothetical protein